MSPFSWLARFWGRLPRHDPPQAAPDVPAEEQMPLYAWIAQHVDPVTGCLRPEGAFLPDEPPEADMALRWAPGARDGTWSHHHGVRPAPERVQVLVRVLRRALAQPLEENRLALASLLASAPVLDVVDGVLAELAAYPEIPRGGLRDLALWLVTGARQREPLKFGIALLGPVRQPGDAHLLLTLGAHDELTLYVATALQQNEPDPAELLWTLARRTRGWGRIHAVERLSALDGLSPAIEDWLLREGFRNDIMPEYLAYPCALNGRLHERLQAADTVDAPLLQSAGAMLRALINGGPAHDMDAYAQGAAAVEAWLALMEARAPACPDCLLTVGAIRDYVDDPQADWTARAERGWHPILRHRIRRACERVLAWPHWRPLVEAGMAARFQPELLSAARLLDGFDPWPWLWQALQDEPGDPGRWAYAMPVCPPEQLPVVLDLAQRSLPMKTMATGPAEVMGLGPGFGPHHCLDAILQGLKAFPGEGLPFILAGLNSPVIRNRNLALQALQAWPTPLDGGLRTALEQLRFREPNADTRARIKRLLRPEAPASPPGENGPLIS